MQTSPQQSPANTPPPAIDQAGPVEPPGAPHLAGRAEPLQLTLVSCCLCGVDDADPVSVGEDFEYRTSPDTFLAMRCRRCGLVYLNPRPSTADAPRIYPPEYHAFDFSAERYGLAYKVRCRLETRRLRRYCHGLGESARILDVGCGDGFHLRLLRAVGKAGWTIAGVDSSERAVREARAAGLDVHLGTIQEVDLPLATYDLALLIATLEHVDDPPAVLARIHALLRPGGRVAIVTDSTATLDFRVFGGRHWGGYHFPRHWNLFNPQALRTLAGNVGFEVESLATIVSPVNWVYSIRNALVDWGAPSWLVERFSLKSTGSLAIFTAVDTVFQLAGKGALLHAVLRRPSDTRRPAAIAAPL